MNRWLGLLVCIWVVALGMSVSVLSSTAQMPRHLKPAGALSASFSGAQAIRRTGSARLRSSAPPAATSPQPAGTPKPQTAAALAPLDTGSVLEAETGQAAASHESVDATPWGLLSEQIFRPTRAIGAEEARVLKEAITPVSDTEHVVNRQAIGSVLSENPFQFLREAVLQPAFDSGRLAGVRLASVPEDGILRQSGFQSGDIIHSINGQPVTNPTLLLQFPSQLSTVEVVEVRIERNGQPVTLTYRLQ